MRLFHSVLGAIGRRGFPRRARSLKRLLEAERAQLPPWFVVGFGSGIAAWFALGSPAQWARLPVHRRGARADRVRRWAAAARAGRSAGSRSPRRSAARWSGRGRRGSPQPRLDRPRGRAVRRHRSNWSTISPPGQTVRLTARAADAALPPRVRVSIDAGQDAAPGIAAGRARCGFAPGSRRRRRWRFPAPTISPATPGSRGSARSARRSAPVDGRASRPRPRGLDAVRERPSPSHPQRGCPASAAGIAIALATGDQNARRARTTPTPCGAAA